MATRIDANMFATDVLTERRSLAERTEDNATLFWSYLDWYRNFRVLLSHPDWFDEDSEFTLDLVKGDQNIVSSPAFGVIEYVFQRFENLHERDQDPKTQLNFFRGNFHTKWMLAYAFFWSDISKGGAIDGPMKNWLGESSDIVEKAYKEFGMRLGLRKNASKIVEELTRRVDEDDSREQSELRLEQGTLASYIDRIREAEALQDLPIEEVRKAFDFIELAWTFAQVKNGKMVLDEQGKQRLIERVAIPLPVLMV